MFKKLVIGFLITITTLFSAATFAEDRIDVEINRLEQVQGNCRAYFLLKNSTTRKFTEFKVDLVLFDKKEIISTRLAVDFQPLLANKTSVKLFDIKDVQCDNLSSILVNEVMSCVHNNQDIKDTTELDCIAIINPKSKVDAKLFK